MRRWGLVGVSLVVGSVALVGPAAFALPISVPDVYQGADSHGYGDVLGETSVFGITSADVDLVANTLTLTINTYYAGKPNPSSIGAPAYGTQYGDLFLSNSWTPSGSQPYATDQFTAGDWVLAFVMDDHTGATTSGSGSVYAVDDCECEDILILHQASAAPSATGSRFSTIRRVATRSSPPAPGRKRPASAAIRARSRTRS